MRVSPLFFLLGHGWLPPTWRPALLALPTVVVLMVGLGYVIFANAYCDPLYVATAEAAGYESGSALEALKALPEYTGTPPGGAAVDLPTVTFGPYCGSDR